MIILNKLGSKWIKINIKLIFKWRSILGTSVSTRLLAYSLRNLSISSSSQPTTTNNPIFAGKLEQHEFRWSPLIARQNTSLIKDVGITCPLWRRKEIFELPLTNKVIENPTTVNKVIEEIINIDKIIELPKNESTSDDAGKQAKNGMIMIRRRKMRKHKLRKLRKKMKYLWAKVRLNSLIACTMLTVIHFRFANVASGKKRKSSRPSCQLKSRQPKSSQPSNTSPRRSVKPPRLRSLASGSTKDCRSSLSRRNLRRRRSGRKSKSSKCGKNMESRLVVEVSERCWSVVVDETRSDWIKCVG